MKTITLFGTGNNFLGKYDHFQICYLKKYLLSQIHDFFSFLINSWSVLYIFQSQGNFYYWWNWCLILNLYPSEICIKRLLTQFIIRAVTNFVWRIFDLYFYCYLHILSRFLSNVGGQVVCSHTIKCLIIAIYSYIRLAFPFLQQISIGAFK